MLRNACSLVLLCAALACAENPTKPTADPYFVGWVTDSLTEASPLYKSPWWAILMVGVGIDAHHSGISMITYGRDDFPVGDPRHRRWVCLPMAGQLIGERQLVYVALGDTLYSYEDPDGPGGDMPRDTAFWTLVNHLADGRDSLRVVLDSALAGLLAERIPGLVALTTGLFEPTVSLYGRGATPENAIVRHWNWTDAAITFFEDSSQAGRRCIS